MRRGTAVWLAAALVSVGCRPAEQAPVIDPRLARYVPEDASALAGFRPEALKGLAGGFAGDRYVLIAIRGSEMVTMTIGADGAVHGQPAMAGRGHSPLLGEAEKLAAHNPGWAVIRGGTALPLEGNLANLNRLLRDAELLTIAAQFGDRIAIDLAATCSTEETAANFEGSLRAILALTRVAASAQVQRDGRRVNASLTASTESVSKLLR